MYNADSHTIDIDGENKDIVDELKDFEGLVTEITIKIKETTDLTEE